MDLQPYCFPVVERKVAVDNDRQPIIDLNDKKSFLDSPYKAIVRGDTNQVISIVKDSYNLVHNEKLISQVLHQLLQSGHSFKLDRSHSFVENNRMRLMFTFPDIKIRDNESDIALSAFIHNSYDMSEGVRFYFGAIRGICTNGMIFGKVMARYYSKHTGGFSFDNLSQEIDKAREQLPEAQNRIETLESSPVTPEFLEKVETKISKRLAKEVIEQEELYRISQWKLLNRLTHYISHDMDQRYRARYQEQVSKVFEL